MLKFRNNCKIFQLQMKKNLQRFCLNFSMKYSRPINRKYTVQSRLHINGKQQEFQISDIVEDEQDIPSTLIQSSINLNSSSSPSTVSSSFNSRTQSIENDTLFWEKLGTTSSKVKYKELSIPHYYRQRQVPSPPDFIEPPSIQDIALARSVFKKQCRMVGSYGSMQEMPDGKCCEVAFAGRSNVGKTS